MNERQKEYLRSFRALVDCPLSTGDRWGSPEQKRHQRNSMGLSWEGEEELIRAITGRNWRQYCE